MSGKVLTHHHPYQHGAGNMIPLDALLTTFTTLNTGQLFNFSVKLLHIPAYGTHLLGVIRAMLRRVIGDHVIGSTGRRRHAKQFQGKGSGHALQSNGFALL